MPKHMEVCLYPEDGWTAEKIQAEIEKRTVKEWVVALHDQDVSEDGDENKPHFHVYLNFGTSNWKLEDVAKWFGVAANKVQKIKSDADGKRIKDGKYYTLRYYTHADYPDKHHYPPENFAANFDVRNYLEQERAARQSKGSKKKETTEVDALVMRCFSGEITRYNYHEHIPATIYSKHEPRFTRAWNMATDKYLIAQNSRRNCKIVWAWGESGYGKTQLCAMVADQLEMAVYVSNQGNDPLHGYKDQPAIILDDIRPDAPFLYAELLKIIDPYHMSGVHARYHDKYPKAKLIFVTTIFSPFEFWSKCEKDDDSDSNIQLERRLYQVWRVEKDGVSISAFDNQTRKTQFISRAKNPIPDFVKATTAAADKSEIDTTGILDTLADKYAALVDQYESDYEQLSFFDSQEQASPGSKNEEEEEYEYEQQELPFP